MTKVVAEKLPKQPRMSVTGDERCPVEKDRRAAQVSIEVVSKIEKDFALVSGGPCKADYGRSAVSTATSATGALQVVRFSRR